MINTFLGNINTELFITFCVLNVLNVIIQTAKSICTIKGGKWLAAFVNAIAYGLYTVVVVYTVCELPLWLKCIVVALANLVGVFVVKVIEEKTEKDKLWKVETTVVPKDVEKLISESKELGLSFNYIDIDKYYLFNFYCQTKKDSENVVKILKNYKVRYFVSESQSLLPNDSTNSFNYSNVN